MIRAVHIHVLCACTTLSTHFIVILLYACTLHGSFSPSPFLPLSSSPSLSESQAHTSSLQANIHVSSGATDPQKGQRSVTFLCPCYVLAASVPDHLLMCMCRCTCCVLCPPCCVDVSMPHTVTFSLPFLFPPPHLSLLSLSPRPLSPHASLVPSPSSHMSLFYPSPSPPPSPSSLPSPSSSPTPTSSLTHHSGIKISCCPQVQGS